MYPPYGLLDIVEIGASREVRLVITYYVYRVGEIESDSCRQRERGRGGEGREKGKECRMKGGEGEEGGTEAEGG